MPTVAKTSFSQRLRTSCAIHWHRSATRHNSCTTRCRRTNRCSGQGDVIERQIRHLARLVEDLLDVSRITRGKIELRRSPVDLAAVVLNAVETSQPLITDRGHEFTIELAPGATAPQCGSGAPGAGARQLAQQRRQIHARGGRISLTAAREGGIVVIRVKDSGIGIAADVLPKIFDMFIQADNRLERATGGLGIGLTLVKHFVEMHGGTVEATSAGIGLGSEFAVRLPLVAVPDAAIAVAASDDAPAQPRLGLRILVVDDNRDSAESMRSLLEILGNDVVTANEGRQALQSIAQRKPDVALLDIGMPKMNGYEVARRIRGESYGDEILLIAMTGWGQEEDRLRSRSRALTTIWSSPSTSSN
jgi:CheY-like chemotaxis protein